MTEIAFLLAIIAQSIVIALLSRRIDLMRERTAGLIERMRKQDEINDAIVRQLEKIVSRLCNINCVGHR